MSRRASDKAQTRTLYALLGLAVASSVLASVVSFKALRAMDGFQELMDAAAETRRAKSLLPEGY